MIPRNLQITIAILLIAMIATALYIIQLKHRAEQRVTASDMRRIEPPVPGPKAEVTLFIAYDDDAVIRPRQSYVPVPQEPSLRAREILRALIGEYLGRPSPHPLAPGADIKDVYLLDGGVAVVDTTPAFADGHRSGIFVEELTVASLVQTLAANLPQVKRVKILVDGKERETLAGHADLATFYDVAVIDDFIKAMR